MIVMKFGGSSVRDAERIHYVTNLVRASLPNRPLLVISALGSTTNDLIAAGQGALKGKVDLDKVRSHHLDTAKALSVATYDLEALFAELRDLLKGISLLQELSKKTLDHLLSFGERLAVRIVAPYLAQSGVPARHFDGWDVGFVTDSKFNDAEIQEETYRNIAERLGGLKGDYSYTPVITGFIGKDANGCITTFGRGGSDLTASVVGAALQVDEIQVWKDVDGILTSDPRLVQAAVPVAGISFEEASELAYFGAKVLHPLSMQPAMQKNIPVRVKNSYNPEHPGTLVTASGAAMNGLVKAITCKRNVTLIDIVSSRMLGQYGFLARVFAAFETHKISVDMVATSEVSISLTLDTAHDLAALKRDLERISSVDIKKGKAIVTIIGEVARSSEILEKTFGVCSRLGVNVQMISQGASKVNISFIVDDAQSSEIVRALHGAFFGGKK